MYYIDYQHIRGINLISVNNTKNVSSSGKASKSKKTSGASSGEFAKLLSGELDSASDASHIEGASAAAPVDAIFATQTIGEEEERQLRKRAIKRSENILEKLEAIREGIIRGYISKDKLMETARFIREKKEITTDKKLIDIMEEVELRAEVELAKLMR